MALRVLEMLPVANRSTTLRDAVERVPTRTNRRFDAALAELDGVVYRLIEEKRHRVAGGARGRDILSLLVRARDEEDTGMTDTQLRDEIMTTLLSGHETSAVALTWTFYLLSCHPEAGREIGDEVRSTLGDADPSAESAPLLLYTRRVFDEVLRLYPPIWRLTRTCVEDDTLGGHRVPAGATIVMVPYFTHRLERFWENPEGFDPDRFLPERFAKVERLAYIPFGAGARGCIGRDFAYLESLLILATAARRVRLSLVPGQVIAIDPRLSLRSKFPLMMRARPVSQDAP